MNKKSILIIDDDVFILELLLQSLESLGYEVVTKESGMSAQIWLSSNRPDLILLDIMLPEINGIEFCKWLNSQDNFKNIPVIHMTAYSLDEIVREESIMSGAKDFIEKPINFGLLEKKIKSLL
ncbi:MAG: response regulator [Elusimicrobia bacterium]|nr:response regulator [Candidatus Liberimonas magnetica]